MPFLLTAEANRQALGNSSFGQSGGANPYTAPGVSQQRQVMVISMQLVIAILGVLLKTTWSLSQISATNAMRPTNLAPSPCLLVQ